MWFDLNSNLMERKTTRIFRILILPDLFLCFIVLFNNGVFRFKLKGAFGRVYLQLI